MIKKSIKSVVLNTLLSFIVFFISIVISKSFFEIFEIDSRSSSVSLSYVIFSSLVVSVWLWRSFRINSTASLFGILIGIVPWASGVIFPGNMLTMTISSFSFAVSGYVAYSLVKDMKPSALPSVEDQMSPNSEAHGKKSDIQEIS